MNGRLILVLSAVFAVACGGGSTPPSSSNEPDSIPTSAPHAGTVSPAADRTDPPRKEEKKVEIHSYEEVLTLFETLNYTPEAWQAGVREVPRVYLTEIPRRWGETTVKGIPVLTKKQLFFRALAPLVLHANELILADRARVETAAKALKDGAAPSAEDRAWLQALAVRYGVADSTDVTVDAALLDALLARVDAVPPALALSQAAEESGWGTSRFAAEGNALFGQWSWGKQAITPEQQRNALGNYGIASFETPLQSVLAYMQNLNTHRAYESLRAKRAELRKAGKTATGRELAATLDHYSERGQAYVDTLDSIMDVNRLDPADQAYLGDGPTIFLVPAKDDTSAGAGSS